MFFSMTRSCSFFFKMRSEAMNFFFYYVCLCASSAALHEPQLQNQIDECRQHFFFSGSGRMQGFQRQENSLSETTMCGVTCDLQIKKKKKAVSLSPLSTDRPAAEQKKEHFFSHFSALFLLIPCFFPLLFCFSFLGCCGAALVRAKSVCGCSLFD